MTVTVDDVKKYLNLGKEVLQVGIVFVPEGSFKDKLKKFNTLLEKDVVVEAVVVVFKLIDEFKALTK